MSYRASELTAMEREAERENAARGRACPIAAALAQECHEAMAPDVESQRFGERWALLERAWGACQDAIEAGRDLDFGGFEGVWDVAQALRFAAEMD